MRIAFLLPGMHRVNRGAEVAFEAVASEIADLGLDQVTVFGSGSERPDRGYAYQRAGLIARERFERFPHVPPFRAHYTYEEATWALMALRDYRAGDFDVSVTCSFPFVNWMATRWPPFAKQRPAHVFVTQNGDHPAFSDDLEYRTFRCDGLVCTNPLYYERDREVWRSTLIPNGIDPARFRPGPSQRRQLGLPEDGPIVLVASALVETKRVLEGLEAVAAIPDAYLVVAGDGPLRRAFDEAGERLMPGRFRRLVLPSEKMPDLYRSVDVLLHPALLESFGNVYIEAMTVGLPVVAHDSSVTRWIFGDDDPGLIDTTDIARMTTTLQAALLRDRNQLLARVADAHARFAWPVIAGQYREFFVDVVEAVRIRRG